MPGETGATVVTNSRVFYFPREAAGALKHAAFPLALNLMVITPNGKTLYAAGNTTLTPIDVASSAHVALAEYQAYRERVGPPPGVRDQPSVLRFK